MKTIQAKTVLHIAYSLGESSAATRLATAQKNKYNIYFLLGRKSNVRFIYNQQLFPNASLFFGISLHILNIIICKILKVEKTEVFSFGLFKFFQKLLIKKIVKKYNIDIIHLHWGGYNFFPLAALEATDAKIIITAHDYQFFTGGCHIPMDCAEFKAGCDSCPLISNNIFKSISSGIFKQNSLNLSNLKLKIAAPSKYTKTLINSVHPKLDINVIPNPIGTQYPINIEGVDKMIEIYIGRDCKESLNLVAVGISRSARDNKGALIIDYIAEKLERLNVDARIVIVGVPKDQYTESSMFVNYGNLTSEKLAEVYAASDLCLVPSRYETFSQVTLESIVCCTPVIAFDMTGPRDIIVNGDTGFLVPSFDVEMYFNAILKNADHKKMNLINMKKNALKTIEKYSGGEIVKKYHEFYDI